MSAPDLPNSTSAAAVGTGSAGATLTNIKPGSLVNGDLLLWAISAYDFSALTLPAGFTKVVDVLNGSRRLVVATKPITDVDNEPASYSTNVSASLTATIAARLYRVTGCKHATPTENASTANNTVDCPDLTASGADRCGVVFYAGTSTSNPVVPIETSLVSQAISTAGPGGEPLSRITVGKKMPLSAGTTSIGNFTGGVSATECVVASLCLIPVDVPVITSGLTAAGQQGSAFAYQVTADNFPTSFGASGLPAGLSLNTASGAITGTPTESGEFLVEITATNASGTDTETLVLTIALPGGRNLTLLGVG